MKKAILFHYLMATGVWVCLTWGWTDISFAQNFAGTAAPETTTEEVQAQAPEEDITIPPEVYSHFSTQTPDDDSNYTLGINDVVSIAVLRHPEVSGEYIINGEGKIQYEFVGDIKIEGLTKKQATDFITEQLSKFIVSPQVTFKIVQYNSKVIYVIGEVARPGKIFMRGDTMTVHEALVEAGLPLLSSKLRKCPIISPSETGEAKKRFVNVFALLYEGDLRENLTMSPGETLYIPATALSKAMRVISPVTQPVSAVGSTGKTVTTGF